MTPHQQENFERAFTGGTSGCTRRCHCGKEFFDAVNDWDFEEGEKNALAERKAVPLDHACGSVVFEGREYVDGCSCWHERASKIIAFIVAHDRAIASFLTLEKQRKTFEAEQSPTVAL